MEMFFLKSAEEGWDKDYLSNLKDSVHKSCAAYSNQLHVEYNVWGQAVMF